ncbi:phosphatase, partial [Streptomyces sp. NPDC055058]
MTRTWQITSTADAAAARAAAARAAALCGAPAVERARLAASVGGRLRQCLTKGGTWALTLD